jgi:hypothetical protein
MSLFEEGADWNSRFLVVPIQHSGTAWRGEQARNDSFVGFGEPTRLTLAHTTREVSAQAWPAELILLFTIWLR